MDWRRAGRSRAHRRRWRRSRPRSARTSRCRPRRLRKSSARSPSRAAPVGFCARRRDDRLCAAVAAPVPAQPGRVRAHRPAPARARARAHEMRSVIRGQAGILDDDRSPVRSWVCSARSMPSSAPPTIAMSPSTPLAAKSALASSIELAPASLARHRACARDPDGSTRARAAAARQDRGCRSRGREYSGGSGRPGLTRSGGWPETTVPRRRFGVDETALAEGAVGGGDRRWAHLQRRRQLVDRRELRARLQLRGSDSTFDH